MKRDELMALADRVEALAGPCRNVDVVICITLGLSETNTVSDNTGWCVGSATNAAPFKSPNYTASLDAAMTLVPEGYCFEVSRWDSGEGSASVSQYNVGDQERIANASTPVLALAAAALRALAAQGD